ncbi:MAG: HU family DNA-binding protein [Kutzneria sp.]|nr:HU family DNA-binding protein [Kutzneria sp.]
MNKAQLIEALAERLGDKKAAGTAVDSLVDIVVRTVHKGEKVNVTGFGVFEKRARAARVARNPRTGETVKVKKTNVPAFRAGTTFKDVVSGVKKLPKAAATKAPARAAAATKSTATRPATSRTRAAATATKPATTRRTAAKATVTKTAAKKAAPKRAVATKPAAKKATVRTAAPKKATARTAKKAAPKRAVKK